MRKTPKNIAYGMFGLFVVFATASIAFLIGWKLTDSAGLGFVAFIAAMWGTVSMLGRSAPPDG